MSLPSILVQSLTHLTVVNQLAMSSSFWPSKCSAMKETAADGLEW